MTKVRIPFFHIGNRYDNADNVMLSEQHRNNTTTTSDNAVQFEATIKNSNAKFDGFGFLSTVLKLRNIKLIT